MARHFCSYTRCCTSYEIISFEVKIFITLHISFEYEWVFDNVKIMICRFYESDFFFLSYMYILEIVFVNNNAVNMSEFDLSL